MTLFRSFFTLVTVGFLVVAGLGFAPQPAAAAGLIPEPTGKCPEDYKPQPDGTFKKTPLGQPCKEGERDYALDDLKVLASNIGNFMLGISGAVLLFVFTLGGFFWLTSAGNPKMVARGTALMRGGVIGLLILFGAYTLVVFGLRTIAGPGIDPFIPKATSPTSGPAGTAPEYSVVKPAAGVAPDQQCVSKLAGTCAAKGACSTSYAVSGACGGNQDCCVKTKNPEQTSPCGQLGGTCQLNSKSCGGAYIKNLCPGQADNIQCCLGS